MRFIKDKWCSLSSWPRVPPTQWLEDAVGGSWEWQWTGFQKDTRKPSLEVSSRAWTLANQSFGLVVMETDRQQLRGKREQQLRRHPGLRQPWWGRGPAPPILPQIQRLLSAPQRPRLPGSGELPGSQRETRQCWRLKPRFSASRPAPSRCPAQLLEQTDLPALSSWAPGGFPSSRLGGDKSLEVNPRVLATGGQFGPVLCRGLSGKPGRGSDQPLSGKGA